MEHDEFVARISDVTGYSRDELLSASFAELGIDSLQILEIDCAVEELGVFLSEAELAASVDVEALYRAFRRGLA